MENILTREEVLNSPSCCSEHETLRRTTLFVFDKLDGLQKEMLEIKNLTERAEVQYSNSQDKIEKLEARLNDMHRALSACGRVMLEQDTMIDDLLTKEPEE